MLIEGGRVGVFALMISSFILDDEMDRAYRTLYMWEILSITNTEVGY